VPDAEKNLSKALAVLDLDPDFPAQRAKAVKLVVLDVDGVLTDGGLYYNDAGLAFKRFDVQDGLGIRQAMRAGIEIALISGMKSGALEQRAADLGITECHAGRFHKLPCLLEIMQKNNLEWENVACMGDDVIDLSMLRLAGLAVAVRNAQPEAKFLAHYISPLAGGRGAVRQVLRHILAAQGRQEELLNYFLSLEEETERQ
jgi:3-deoxy-D-manno-octulosonate 8-phosphate phosphatase (KDO 8-P phosphatase)